MRPVTVQKQLAGANAGIVAAAQALGAAGNLTLVGGGTVTLDTQRRIILTSSGNDSARKAIIFGTTEGGAPIKEQVTLKNAGVVASVLDFKTVTKIAVDGAVAGTLAAGTNTTGSTSWKLLDNFVDPFELSLYAKVLSGNVTGTLEYTYDDVITSPAGLAPSIDYAPLTPQPTPIPLGGMTDMVGNTEGQILFGIRAWRLTVTAGTGLMSLRALQAGLSAA